MRVAFFLLPLSACGILGGGPVVFRSSGGWTGDLVGAAGGGDALDAADSLCDLSGQGAGHKGPFKAWISTADGDAIDRIDDAGPWRVPGRGRAFLNAAALVGSPEIDIDADEHGAERVESAWTGTDNGGRWSGVDCGGWTSDADEDAGTSGEYEGPNWSSGQEDACSNRLPLICFEQ